jgi:hypothetical protein
VAVDTRPEALNARVDALRVGFAGQAVKVRARNLAYLRAFSPDFESRIGEHDQWPDDFKQEAADHFRSSYNLTRAVVELWTSLEMSEFPALRWWEAFLPTPVPSMDPQENEIRQTTYRAAKLVARQVATIREQTLNAHVRRSGLPRHAYKAVLRKNVYGHSWLKTVPDPGRRTFRVFSRIDPSTVFPAWSHYEDEKLDAILVATRRSAQSVNAEFPGLLQMNPNGLTIASLTGYYQPTQSPLTDADLAFVWMEDYWLVDDEWEQEVSDDDVPVRSRVINVVRAGGKIARVVEYPGWRAVPYVRWENENERDHLGFSDVATMLPIQDSLNRFMSQQQDVIAGESRPKFKYRGDSDRSITFGDEDVVSLDADEDIEQIQVHLDVFPTQVHGQQLLEVLARATGLPDTVWGRITAAQNSGRALATAWRSVAARMVPRTQRNALSLDRLFGLWLDWMELYEWDHARDLYSGNRDFDLDFPNQEPRDFAEVTTDALNKLGAGLIDTIAAMEKTGERSPDEMIDRVRTEYMDAVLHPDKSQGYLLLTRLKNQIAIEAQQAGIAAEQAAQQLAQLRATPPAGAPGAGTPDQQVGAANQARTQAAQQAAPQLGPGQNQAGPATQAGAPANPGNNSTKVGTLVQDGKTFNRIIDQGTISGG